MSATEAPGSASPSATGATKGLRIHSCVLCQQRKVKCDRQDPCAGCIKAGVECISSIPAPPRRRKRKLPEGELHARLKRYEELLKGYGAKLDGEAWGDVEPEPSGGSAATAPRQSSQPAGPKTETISPGPERGKLIAERGMSRYLDNNLWTDLSEELRDPKEMLQRPSDEERFDSPMSDSTYGDGGSFLLGSTTPITSLTGLHPQPVHIFRLWQTFLDNVNPLSKLLHAPTVQHQILEASSNLHNIPRPMEALMFAIYAAAVTSLDDIECENMLGESRSALLARYSTATQHALIRAGFLKSSDLVVLQAFTLFLLSVRQHYDPHALWILTGVAVRIGQRMGIHRDGSSLGLSIFEAEMRRRICWQIVLLDSRSAQLSGTGISVTAHFWDTKLPSNVNDSDLNPEMREMPMAHTGITEMVFCLIRYEVGNFLRGAISVNGFDGNWAKLSSTGASLSDKDKMLDDLESYIESRFLRYCDPLIPLHTLSAAVARSAICKMRLVAHHPRQYPDKGASMSQEEKDMLFTTSLKMIEYDTMGQSMKSMKRFLWHINVYFQLDAFIYMVSELRHRTSGQLADRAWHQIQEVYDHHPELIRDTVNALYVAIGNLTVKAWESRASELACQNQTPPEVPRFITMLQSQRQAKNEAKSITSPASRDASVRGGAYVSREPQVNDHHQSQETVAEAYMGGLESDFQFDSLVMNMSPMDWDYWNDLLQANELQALGGNGQRLFG